MKMEVKYYPDQQTVQAAMDNDNPLLVLISYDGRQVLISDIDDAFEHVILLRKLGINDNDIDRYFRLVVSKSGTDWTFVCPKDYKNLQIEDKRIQQFYKDGFSIIPQVLKIMGYSGPLTIPQRYQRHIRKI